MTAAPKPEFATNRPGERVADAINSHLAYLRSTWSEPPRLAIATAYFNPGGYGLLADELDHPAQIRLLLGADPQVAERRVRPLSESPNPARAARAHLRHALLEHGRSLEQDRDLLGFSVEADATGRRLVDWLGSGNVEVRRLENSFLHGKAFIVTSHDEGVIAGSSNFTFAGLATNIELNLGHYQPHVVAQVRDWFDHLWEQARPFDLAALYAARFEPHSPYLVYLRMLSERYGAELADEAASEGLPRIHLTSFQRDGLWRAKRLLAERHGVLIADEVGLGKTYLGGELIREAVEERRQRVLVIAPATLRDGPWRRFLLTYGLGVECISFEDLVTDSLLSPETGSGRSFQFHPREYAMVVIDEAHNLRNPSTLRANALRRLLAGSPPKDVVLLTATPVNNSLWDLYYVLGYFLRNDATFADVGIRSLRDHFAAAMAMNPDDLSPEHLFDVLDAVAVRRTRSFVKRYYPNDSVIGPDGKAVPIVFPQPRVIKVDYDLDGVLPGFFDRFAHALDTVVAGSTTDPTVLTLARYAPSRYRLDGEAEAYEVQLAGLIRSGLLKRFESSAHAFAVTCRKMAASHSLFLSVLERGKVATGQALRDWPTTDADEESLDEYVEINANLIDDALAYDCDALRADVERDRELLVAWADEADSVTPEQDPKLAVLLDQLADIALQAKQEGIGKNDERDRRKVLIFSYFADTVRWIDDFLEKAVTHDSRLAAYRDRLVSLSGTFGSKEAALWGFAPRTTDAPEGEAEDLYDVVVSTDVLSEGVNLQQARHIINYDLPWNPMRLVQRHGRIDRIGSLHTEVFLRCVFPDRQLDELLGLEQRLHRKIQQAAKSVGTTEVLPGGHAEELVFSETREEIDRLREGDASIFERGGTSRGALSGEEFRQELRQALENEILADRVAALPWGSGSGMAVERDGVQAGFVFCARVGDHDKALYRYVVVADGVEPVVVGDTLACLDHARPPRGFDTPRQLDEATYQKAFVAWYQARTDIEASWNRAADPANLTPPVPVTMNRAAELVREYRPPEMTVEDADRLMDALQTPYPERIVRSIRAAMASANDPVDQVRELALYARDLGLEPSPPPQLLPEITEEDIHLVCWLAIVPRERLSAGKAAGVGAIGSD
ncbi:MAG: phospholipase D-like domain-containing protein [Actinomycetota bacterium]|nr:phospholipase D-like domain-containing protein [Actinomycetota bacterium]